MPRFDRLSSSSARPLDRVHIRPGATFRQGPRCPRSAACCVNSSKTSCAGAAIRSSTRPWSRVLFAVSLIWLLPALACGSFAPRPTPTPTAGPEATVLPEVVGAAPGAQPAVQTTPLPVVDTPTPLPEATPTFTPTSEPGTALAAGRPARIVAPGGLNMRDVPSTGGVLVVQAGAGQLVTVVDGPTSADGFTWWQIDDGAGRVGWVADGDGETEWLSPNTAGVQAVNRPPRVGDRVRASIQLSLRSQPGTGAALITQIAPGAEFTVLAGPQPAGGYNWYQIRSDDGSLEGWAADGDGTDRWLSPLE